MTFYFMGFLRNYSLFIDVGVVSVFFWLWVLRFRSIIFLWVLEVVENRGLMYFLNIYKVLKIWNIYFFNILFRI